MQVICNGKKYALKKGASFEDLAVKVQDRYDAPIMLAKVGQKLRELAAAVEEGETVSFLTLKDRDGLLTYERSLLMLLNKAIRDVAGAAQVEKVLVKFSVIKGYYAEVRGAVKVDEAFVAAVKEQMERLVGEDHPIIKLTADTGDVRTFFRMNGQPDKDRLLRFRRSSTTNIYALDDYVDYFYGAMVPSTGYLTLFDLVRYEDGMALLTPNQQEPERVAEFQPQPKIFQTLQAASQWSEAMGISNVGDINRAIADGKMTDLILMAEARQEHDIAEIASQIAARPSVKCVMIAGPSSSGKTSFSHRLSVQLKGLGLTPHPIEVDNYFVDRSRTPRDENGNYDFETIDCVDIELFNRDMLDLLAGREVKMPTYNFTKGCQEYKGNTLQIGEKDILVIEGIHCLNEKLSASIPEDRKFKIYISALTQTNVDDHNRIPTSDGRLLRRIIRDARTRGHSAAATIGMWPSVQRGERLYILPFQESADAVFNSSLVYEFSVLKAYAEPLLFGIPEDAPEFPEANRLLKFLDYFLAVDSTQVPQNSLIKEFIGGSIFKV